MLIALLQNKTKLQVIRKIQRVRILYLKVMFSIRHQMWMHPYEKYHFECTIYYSYNHSIYIAQVLVPNCSISLSQSCDLHRGLRGCQDAVAEGPGLVEVKLLVEQKRAVERELMELKSQLEKAGFSSLSQMRYSYPYNKWSNTRLFYK